MPVMKNVTATVGKSEIMFSNLVEFALILGWGTPDVFSLER